MKPTEQPPELGPSLWLYNNTRQILDNGTLRPIADLTSNPAIFDEASGSTTAYDEGIRGKALAGKGCGTRLVELGMPRFIYAGIDIDALALQLQHEGTQAFGKCWQRLMYRIVDKCVALVDPGNEKKTA